MLKYTKLMVTTMLKHTITNIILTQHKMGPKMIYKQQQNCKFNYAKYYI